MMTKKASKGRRCDIVMKTLRHVSVPVLSYAIAISVMLLHDYYDNDDDAFMIMNLTNAVAIVLGSTRFIRHLSVNMTIHGVALLVVYAALHVPVAGVMAFTVTPTIACGIVVHSMRAFMITPVTDVSLRHVHMCIIPVMLVESLAQTLVYGAWSQLDLLNFPSEWYDIAVGSLITHTMVSVPALLAVWLRIQVNASILHAVHVLLMAVVLISSTAWLITYTLMVCACALSYALTIHHRLIADAGSDTSQSTFLSNMSHELRTPLNALLGSIQLLKTTRLHHEQSKYLDVCHNASEMMLSIINDILDYSKLEAGALETRARQFQLPTAIHDAATVIGQQALIKNVEVVLDMDTACPQTVVADAKLLQQILVNLLGNAVKFTSKGFVCVHSRVLRTRVFTTDDAVRAYLDAQPTGYNPTMPTRAGMSSASKSRLRSGRISSAFGRSGRAASDRGGGGDGGDRGDRGDAADGDSGVWSHILISIEDTGCGIADEHNIEALFHRFYQCDSSSTKTHEGTGLGLAISLRLARLFHGQVGAVRNRYKGTTFWFTAWIRHSTSAEVTTQAPQQQQQQRMPQSSEASVHIIHHNAHVLELLEDMVQSTGRCRTSLAPGPYFSRQFITKFVADIPNDNDDNIMLLVHSSVMPVSELVQLPPKMRDFFVRQMVYFGASAGVNQNGGIMHLNNPLDIGEMRTALYETTRTIPSLSSTPLLTNASSIVVRRMQKYRSAPAPVVLNYSDDMMAAAVQQQQQQQQHTRTIASNDQGSGGGHRFAGIDRLVADDDQQSSTRSMQSNAPIVMQKQNACMDVLFQQSSRYLSVSSEDGDHHTTPTAAAAAAAAHHHRRNRSSVSSIESKASFTGEDDALCEQPPSTSHTHHVLIAEDNRLNQVVVVSLLRRCGNFNTTCVSNGLEAVNAYKTSIQECGTFTYDAILMDCYMPTMDGFKAAREIRIIEADRGIQQAMPIIAFTASTTKSDHDECYSSGMNGIVTKPVRVNVMVAELHKHISSSSSVSSPSPSPPPPSSLPTKQQQQPPPTRIPVIAERTSVCRVLIVEDNRLNQMILMNMLRRHSIFVMVTAMDGVKGLATYTQHQGTPNAFDVVLMDCYMPNMDGFQCTQAIRAEESSKTTNGSATQIPIIAVTASTTREDHARCYECGMNDVITKPVRIQVLLDVLRKHVESCHDIGSEPQGLGA